MGRVRISFHGAPWFPPFLVLLPMVDAQGVGEAADINIQIRGFPIPSMVRIGKV